MECTDLREKAGPQGDIIPIISSELGLYLIFQMSYISIYPSHLTVCLEYLSLNSSFFSSSGNMYHHLSSLPYNRLLTLVVFPSVFSCPQQLNRTPCPLVRWSGTTNNQRVSQHYRVTLETCDL